MNIYFDAGPSGQQTSANLTDTDKNKTAGNAPDLHQRMPELGILRSICITLDSHKDIIGGHPDLSNAARRLNDYTAKITQKYSEARNLLIRHLIKVSSALKNYGVMCDNSELIGRTSVKEQILREMSDEELFRFGAEIKEYVKVYSDTLCYLGLEQNSLDIFHETIDHFSYATGLSGSDVYQNAGWKQEIDRNYDEAFNLIHNTLDHLAERIRARYPGFYSDYLRSKAFPAAGDAG
ncbi:MAG: hypothetical protein ACM3U0_00060 [archaeon]